MFYDFITKRQPGADKRYVCNDLIRREGLRMADEMMREPDFV
jgi:hypothetical protein